jgi:hypothetical protein
LAASPVAGMAEVIVTSGLTTTQRTSVISYMRARYGNQ